MDLPEQESFSTDSMLDYVLPQPTSDGVAELQQLYLELTGTSLSEEDAAEGLRHLITIVWHRALIAYEHEMREGPSARQISEEAGGLRHETRTHSNSLGGTPCLQDPKASGNHEAQTARRRSDSPAAFGIQEEAG